MKRFIKKMLVIIMAASVLASASVLPANASGEMIEADEQVSFEYDETGQPFETELIESAEYEKETETLAEPKEESSEEAATEMIEEETPEEAATEVTEEETPEETATEVTEEETPEETATEVTEEETSEETAVEEQEEIQLLEIPGYAVEGRYYENSSSAVLMASAESITVWGRTDLGDGDMILRASINGETVVCYCVHPWNSRTPDGNQTYIARAETRNALGYVMHNGVHEVGQSCWGLDEKESQWLTQLAVFIVIKNGEESADTVLYKRHTNSYGGAILSFYEIYVNVFGQTAADEHIGYAKTLAANALAADRSYLTFVSGWKTDAGTAEHPYQEVITYNPAGYISLKKSALASGYSASDLYGAVYEVKDSAGNHVGAFAIGGGGTGYTIDLIKNGAKPASNTSYENRDKTFPITAPYNETWGWTYGSKLTVAPGEYYVSELAAPYGGKFLIGGDSAVMTVASGETVTFEVSDVPKMDPVGLILQKKTSAGEGAPSLAGARFSIAFYDGITAASPADIAGKKASRTWVYKTDDRGRMLLRDTSLKVSGDGLYYNVLKKVSLPPGTLVIKETLAPEGYMLNPDTFIASLSIDSQGNGTWQYYRQAAGGQSWTKLGSQRITIDQETDLGITVDENMLPSISTMAVDSITGTHTGVTGTENDRITDKVHLKNVVPGTAYRLKAELVDKDTKKVISAVSRTFTVPESSEGFPTEQDVTMPEFRIDPSELAGKSVVVFEYLSLEGSNEVISEHTELLDEDQTIRYPRAETEASDVDTKSHAGTVKENAVITDEVKCHNLVPGEEYTVTGRVVYKSSFTDKAGIVHEAGEEVQFLEESIAEVTFTADQGEMTVNLKYVIDSTLLEKAAVVIFEDLENGGVVVYSHADLEDEDQSIYYPSVMTTAADSLTDDNVGAVRTDAVIVDTVRVSNLVAGQTYTITGVLMDQETGEENGIGQIEMTPVTFTASGPEEQHQITFTGIDGTLLEGHSLVVFEDLFCNGVKVAEHRDMTDPGQTIYFPDVETSAVDSRTGTHVGGIFGVLINVIRQMLGETVLAEDQQIITDTVKLTNLVNGRTYTVEGILMDKEEGQPLLIGGEEVTQSAVIEVKDGEITAPGGETVTTSDYDEKTQSVSGTVDITFMLDSSELVNYREEGDAAEMVVFETLKYNGLEVAAHADLEDEMQSISDAVIATRAFDAATGTHVGDSPRQENAHADISDEEYSVITDEAAMRGLIPGEEYTLVGRLVLTERCSMEKAVYLSPDGLSTEEPEEAVTVTDTFTADEADMSRIMEFTVSSRLVSGEKVTVFESLYHEGVLITAHADCSDENQTVYYPKVRTELLDSRTRSHSASAEKKMVLIDTVTYKNLIPGEKYTFRGILYDKKTGRPALDDGGKEITSKITDFSPEEADGSVSLEFKFDGAKLEGSTIVAFEILEYNGIAVYTHADINDSAQSVNIPEPETTTTTQEETTPETTKPEGPVPSTGDRSSDDVLRLIITGLSAMAALGAFILIRKKYRRSKRNPGGTR